MRDKFSRRAFIGGLLGLAGGAVFYSQARQNAVPGKIVGSSMDRGHMLRSAVGTGIASRKKTGILIVGAGIAGLSAGWRLKKEGVEDFLILDLESSPGGNSSSGRNSVSAYPWGAHYIPVPGRDAVLVRELLEDLGVITGHDAAGKPIYDELHICGAPEERLFIHGRWQEGLIPSTFTSADDNRQFEEFFAFTRELSEARGADGRPAFTVPSLMSSSDPRFLEFDRISMRKLMDDRNWTSEYLRWYVDYCCRDDFGVGISSVSAWAALHYFSSRNVFASNVGQDKLLTWPEGNGWVVERLKERLAAHLIMDALVVDIDDSRKPIEARYLDFRSEQLNAIESSALVYCGPRFTAPHVIRSLRSARPAYLGSFDYSPWMVANITINSKPANSERGFAWDNVIFGARSLGYVSAHHQKLQIKDVPGVLTYYLPLDWESPTAMRQWAAGLNHNEWTNLILEDLNAVHPGFRECVDSIDVRVWGHAMVRPVPGFITGPDLKAAREHSGNVIFAHSDISGMSLFEEAQHWGSAAARAAIHVI